MDRLIILSSSSVVSSSCRSNKFGSNMLHILKICMDVPIRN